MFDKNSLHHAYFIEGDKTLVLADLEQFLKDSFGITREGHPDVHYAEYESLGIDESRALQDMQFMRPIMGNRKIFIIATGSLTGEAQNSLLKVFEEPTPGTHFFVISSSQRILLPTLRSRMVVVRHASASSTAHSSERTAKKFLTLSPKARFEFVADLIEEKDRAGAEEFIQDLMNELHEKKNIKALKEIIPLAGYVKDRASSLKLILERIALLHL